MRPRDRPVRAAAGVADMKRTAFAAMALAMTVFAPQANAGELSCKEFVSFYTGSAEAPTDDAGWQRWDQYVAFKFWVSGAEIAHHARAGIPPDLAETFLRGSGTGQLLSDIEKRCSLNVNGHKSVYDIAFRVVYDFYK